MNNLKRFILFIAMFTFLAAGPVLAQSTLVPQGTTITPSTPTLYSLTTQGGLLITVNLWGYVGKPGQYEVPSSTDIVQLISLAGGPAPNAEIDKVEIVRRITQPDSSVKTEVIPVNLTEFKEKGDTPPLLSPGDTIIVPGETHESLRLFLSIIAPIFSLLTSIGTMILILRR